MDIKSADLLHKPLLNVSVLSKTHTFNKMTPICKRGAALTVPAVCRCVLIGPVG